MADSRRSLFAIVLISGMCSLLVEIAGSRVLAPYMGATIYTWAAVIGFVLAALSLGYYVGGVLADRYNDRRHFSYILLAAGLSTLMVPFLGSAILPFTLFLDLASASLIGALILVPASLFYGMVSPYAIKLTSEKGAEGRSAGVIFAVSTVGSIAGAIGTGFVLIPNVAITHIFILAAGLMLLSSWLASGIRKESLMDVAPFLALSALTLTMSLEPPITGNILFAGDSAYYHLRVVDTEWNGGPARLLLLDNAASSGERENGEPAFEYVMSTREVYSEAGEVQGALVIGSAAGTEMEELKRFFPNASVTGLEIDPKAAELGMEYFSLKDDNRTEIIIEDARRHLLLDNSSYDLVLIDAFRGHSIPPHLATSEFLSLLRSRVSPGGLVTVNLISSLEGPRSHTFAYLHSTFSSVFGTVVVMPVKSDPYAVQNIVLIATDRDMSEFIGAHGDEIYSGPVPDAPPLTDELNPIELYALR